MKIAKNKITTTTTFFKMDEATGQLVVVLEGPDAGVVNVVKADERGRVISSIWGELERDESSDEAA